MPMRERTLQAISVVGIVVLLVQGALSFSDIDRTGWMLVGAYIGLVIAYIVWRSPSQARAAGLR